MRTRLPCCLFGNGLIFLAILLSFTSTVSIEACSGEEPANAASDSPISFSGTISPIFQTHCYGCHQGAKQKGDYLMTDFTALLSGGETGQAAIVPGKPEESYLLEQITPVDGHAEMPKGELPPLADSEIEQIRKWIAAGAPNDSKVTGPVFSAANPPIYPRAPVLTSVDISPDNTLCAVAGFHEVLLLDAASGERVGRLVGLSPRVNSVAFSPDGTRLAVAGGSPATRGELQVWDVATKSLQLSLPVTYDNLTGVSWSPDGKQIAFACADTTVRAVDAETGQQVLYQSAHDDWVRDTVYSQDGSHLISVGRDMTVKLIEVATERFVDNVTSITPGALAGGVNAIDRHPERDELLVGGADGVPKIYRIFRQTARKIGDDANLVLRLPALQGRIFSVDISPDGSRLAAVATVDGRSEVRVWQYDLGGDLPADVKAIQAKRINQRKPVEIEKLKQYLSKDVKQLTALTLDDAAVFSLAFAPDNRLMVAAADGTVRVVGSESGAVEATWAAAPVTPDAAVEQVARFDAAAWSRLTSESTTTSATDTLPSIADVTELRIEPAAIELDGSLSYNQLLVFAELKNGAVVDVTRGCEIDAPEFVALDEQGLLRPLRHGTGKLVAKLGERSAHATVTASNLETPRPIDFVRDVNPVLSRLGCNQGTCHGAAKGKNGFKLSLRGYDPIFDVRALSDDLAGRRLNSVSPDDSLMLRKPLGLAPHEGGVLMQPGDPYHAVLRRWISDGAQLDLRSPKVERIELQPENPTVQQIGSQQQVRVIAFYPDGQQRDVTREAFIESGNSEVATANRTALLTALRRGEAPILARYEGAYAATTLTVMGDRDGFEWQTPESWGAIDDLVAKKWQRMKLLPSELCTDEAFIRRVTLDLTGLPPTSTEVREFLADERPTREKRQALTEKLIGNEAFIEYWTNKWADLLQVNRKFLGTEGSTKFRQWIRTAVEENRPYDQFANQILTASGSNNQNPAAAYFKILRDPETTVENTTHLFLGIRFNCNKCHDHPFERWTQDQYYQTAAFFAHVDLKKDPESKDRKIGGTAVEGAKPLFEEVYDKPSGEVLHGRTNKPVEAVFPFEAEFEVAEDATRRERLSAWMTSPNNQYFARSYVNRIWGYLTGVGLIEPIDDIRAGNPPTNPELLDYLTEQFIASNFDSRQLMREICQSRTYQLSVTPNRWNADDQQNYAHATPRRLPAEVLFDAVHAATGSQTHIPGVPAGTRAAELPDSGVELADGFLANLGRPVRESACECERSTDLQLGSVMALVSGPTIGSAISDAKNDLATLVKELPDDKDLVEELFLRLLARKPTDAEFATFQTIRDQIQADHDNLVATLQQTEQWWVEERAKREAQRLENIANVKQQMADLLESLQPEIDKQEQARQTAIEAAKADIAATESQTETRREQWLAGQAMAAEWFPLRPSGLSASNKAQLRSEADRAIVASGVMDKGTYTITVQTHLPKITGFRLETLPVADRPGGGPGFPENGNFVVTEFQVTAAAMETPDQATAVKLKNALADFSQSNFTAAQMIDGKTDDQGGWAVSPAGGVVHWATFQTAEPIAHPQGTVLTFQIHQFHNAADHRLARFRLSATTEEGEVKLGLPESLAATAATPRDQRSEQQQTALASYYAKIDNELATKQEALAVASRPLPEDKGVTALKRRLESLQTETPPNAGLLQLRKDLEQSTAQLQQLRLTAAEDLTWALINSPAFLFNR